MLEKLCTHYMVPVLTKIHGKVKQAALKYQEAFDKKREGNAKQRKEQRSRASSTPTNKGRESLPTNAPSTAMKLLSEVLGIRVLVCCVSTLDDT